MSIVFACLSCGSPSIALPDILDDEALVHCGRCRAVVGRWGPFKALARRRDQAGPDGKAEAPMPVDDAAHLADFISELSSP